MFFAFEDGVAHEWECDASEVGTASEAGNDHIGIFAGHLHLFFGFQADYSLVQSDVAQYGTECILTVGCGSCQLDGLGNGRAQRTLVVGVSGQNIFPARVDMEGEGVTCAPKVCMILRR